MRYMTALKEKHIVTYDRKEGILQWIYLVSRGTLTGELVFTESSCVFKNWPYLLRLGIIWANGKTEFVSYKNIGEDYSFKMNKFY